MFCYNSFCKIKDIYEKRCRLDLCFNYITKKPACEIYRAVSTPLLSKNRAINGATKNLKYHIMYKEREKSFVQIFSCNKTVKFTHTPIRGLFTFGLVFLEIPKNSSLNTNYTTRKV